MDRDDYLVCAALLSQGQNAATLADALAARFERSLPTHVDVDRAGWGKHKKLKTLNINLEPGRFRIEIDNHGSPAWIDQIVRGVCLKSENVDMDTWLDRLAAT